MQNQELINWIKSEKAKGFSDSELKKSYLEFGGSEVLYNMAMAEMNKVDHLEVEGSKKKYITWLVICILITLVIGIISYFIWDTREAVIVTKKINVNESSISCVTEGKSYLDIYPLPEKECCDGLVKGLTTCEKCIGEGVGISDDGVPCCEGLSANNNESKCRKIEENNLNSVLSMDTSTWQTYRSEEGKFEFMYPSFVSINEYLENDVAIVRLEDMDKIANIKVMSGENIANESIYDLSDDIINTDLCNIANKNIKIGSIDVLECNDGENIFFTQLLDVFWVENKISSDNSFDEILLYNILNTIKPIGSPEEREGDIMLKDRDTKRLADLRVFQTAIELYISDNGTIPKPTNITDPWRGEENSLFSLLSPYLPLGVPEDASTEYPRQWLYCFNSKNNKYMVANSLERNREVVADLDNINNWDSTECISSIKEKSTNVLCEDSNLGSIGNTSNATIVCLGSDDLE